MWKWLVEKWDWWIYCRSFHSLRRICERSPGFAVVMQCHLNEYLERNPVPEQLRLAAEKFYEATAVLVPDELLKRQVTATREEANDWPDWLRFSKVKSS